MLLLLTCALAAYAPDVGKFNCVRTAPYHPAVHTFGNVGVGGGLHAALARFATWSIDMIAYAGVDMREHLAAMIAYDTHARVSPPGRKPKILEIGCGSGALTQELLLTAQFENVTAVDTSAQMVAMAKWLSPGADYSVNNGVDMADGEYDAVVIAMVMHEMPVSGHVHILETALAATRGRNGKVWIADVHPSHAPSPMFLSGEPYVMTYLSTFEDTVDTVAQTHGVYLQTLDLIPNHLRVWTLAHVVDA